MKQAGNTNEYLSRGLAHLNENTHVLPELKPYREYFITVQAVTIKPGGIANCSAKTHEGGMKT